MTLPSALLTHTTESCWPSGVAVVTQIWSPQMTGEDQALPAMGTDHFTFSVALHLSGRPVAVE